MEIYLSIINIVMYKQINIIFGMKWINSWVKFKMEIIIGVSDGVSVGLIDFVVFKKKYIKFV